jgi:hypothetical protein
MSFVYDGSTNNSSLNAVPIQSSSSSSVFSSGYYSSLAPHLAFNGSNSTSTDCYCSDNTDSFFIGYVFDEPIIINKYMITSRKISSQNHRTPKNFTLEASNDGITWVVLDTQNDISDWSSSGNDTKSFGFYQDASYTHYRLNVSSGNGDSLIYIGELYFVEAIFEDFVISAELQSILDSMQFQIDSLDTSSIPDNLQSDLDTINTNIQTLQDDISTLNTQNDTFNFNFTIIDDTIATLQQAITDIQDNGLDIEELTIVQNNFATFQTDFNTLKTDYEAFKTNQLLINADTSEKLTLVNGQIASIITTIETLQNDSSISSDTETELNSIKLRLQILEDEMTNVELTTATKTELETLSSTVTTLQTSLQTLTNTTVNSEALETVQTDLNNLNSSLTITINDLNSFIENQGTINDTVNTTLTNLQTQITQNQTIITDMQNDDSIPEDIQNRLSTLETTQTLLQNEVTRIQTVDDKTTVNATDIQAIQTLINANQLVLNDLVINGATGEQITTLQTNINVLDQEVNELLTNLQNDLTLLQDQVNTLEADNEDDVELADLQNVKDELTQFFNDRVAEINQNIAGLTTTVQSMSNPANSFIFKTIGSGHMFLDSDIVKLDQNNYRVICSQSVYENGEYLNFYFLKNDTKEFCIMPDSLTIVEDDTLNFYDNQKLIESLNGVGSIYEDNTLVTLKNISGVFTVFISFYIYVTMNSKRVAYVLKQHDKTLIVFESSIKEKVS